MNDHLLKRMRHNPAGDWTIGDIQTVCSRAGARCAPPSGGGSHCKISHPSQSLILTIPRARTIKAAYIRRLIKFIEAVGDDERS